MGQTINNLENIILMPVYSSFKCLVYSQKDHCLTEEGIKLLNILFRTEKVHIKCINCKQEYPFDVSNKIEKTIFPFNNYSYNFIGDTLCNLNDGGLVKHSPKFPAQDEGYIMFLLRCNMDKDHYYKMFLFYKLNNGLLEIIKAGQLPLSRDLGDSLSTEYKDILDKYDSFEDYRMYEQSKERNLLAGACTYLRRVFEKMILKMIQDPSIDDEKRKKAFHFDEKIKLAKDQFDSDIQDVLEESYDLLSKGVHELSNEDIKDFCSLLEEVINVQLESEREKAERTKKMSELRRNIHRQHTKKA